MKYVAALRWVFTIMAFVCLAKACVLIYGEQLMDVQLLATRMQLVAVGWGIMAVGCGIIEAIGKRSVGQAGATNKANENEAGN